MKSYETITRQQLMANSSSRLTRLERELAQQLLSIGGDRVILAHRDDHAKRCVADGQLFDLKIKRVPGERNHCHTNAAALWGREVENSRIVTGYALVRGAWRRHSWVVMDDMICETTTTCDRYFGFILTDEEAAEFWMREILFGLYSGVVPLLDKCHLKSVDQK